ncbi:MAG: SDR family oxidoreductase [Ruminococcaceae bacterium]|nr:SDR family oxidoreductase [Oscillospiraceae bacterium]
MKALITGASSGIGRDIARVLSEMGYDIIAVARRIERLEELKKELKTNVEIISLDVTNEEECRKLALRASEIDVFINNAGFGVFGDFCSTDLDAELKMIDTNIYGMHILLKLFLKEFKKRDSGYILNVASLAAFFPGPLFGAYYASKAYVLRITQSIAEELRQEKSNVKISVLCPGPVKTEFENVAKVSFGNETEKIGKNIILSSRTVAEYAVKKLFKGKMIIVPGFIMRIAVLMRHILPDKLLSRAVFFIQSKKMLQEKTIKLNN